MTDSTLNQQYADIRRWFGLIFGLGRDPSNDWSANTVSDVQACMDLGAKEFLKADGRHKWSFKWFHASLVIYADITTASGDTVSGGAFAGGVTVLTISGGNTTMRPAMVGRTITITGVGSFVISAYTSGTSITVTGDASSASGALFSITAGGFFRLPDVVAALDGPIYFDEDDSHSGTVIKLVQQGALLHLRQEVTMTSYPQYAALVPAITDQTEQAKYDLFVYPDPDATYTLKYKYDRFADALSSTLTDVYGSGIHDDTVLYAMLAKWESLIDGNPNGECNQKYRELLALSIEKDKRAMRAEFVGRLRTDDSDGPGRLEARDQTTTITFQGSSLD